MNLIKNQSISNSKEIRLLLLCARKELTSRNQSELLKLIQKDINWEYLIEYASAHRLIPLLYWSLKTYQFTLPKNVFNKLSETFRTIRNNNLLLLAELLNLTKLFENKDITVIPYKGSVLSILAYNNITLREFGDIDLFIRSKDASIIKNIMLSNGYELLRPINIEDNYYMKFEQEYQFINKTTFIIIEIKWKIEGNFFYLPNNFEIIPNKLRQIKLNNIPISTFSSVDHILILCIHAAKHDWNRLSWLCDISEYIKSQEIDWCEILEKSSQMNINKILFINLILSKDLFDLKLPENILRIITSNKSSIDISIKIKEKILMNKSINLFDKFVLDLNKRDNIVYGIKDSINGLTKPTYTDFLDFSLPKSLFYLYFIIRPFFLLKRYGKNSL